MLEDSGGTANGGDDASAPQTVGITVDPVNDAPAIAVVAGVQSQSACLSDTSGRITLTLLDPDGDTLTLSAASSNTRVLPANAITFAGSGGTRTATISTVSGRTGSSTVTITASDGQMSGSVPVTVKAGGNGKNTLDGTGGADLLLGKNRDDALSGFGGSDVLCGANGDDRLSGGAHADTFDGGAGVDTTSDYDPSEGDSRINVP